MHVHACNCQYGTQDPRCCIRRAQRRHDEEVWEMGRQGIPLPEEKPTADAIWQAVADARAKMEAENL